MDWKGERSGAIAGAIRNLVRGKKVKADGQPYSPRFCRNVWKGLSELNQNPDLKPYLDKREGSEELCRLLFRSGIATMTGRVRGRVSFCQARNTPFQGLAADGAKLALWALIREGFRVVGFVHDEVLVELPDRGGYVEEAEARKIVDILCQSMETVTGNVPVECDYALAYRWSKDAKAIVQDGKLLAWEPVAKAA